MLPLIVRIGGVIVGNVVAKEIMVGGGLMRN